MFVSHCNDALANAANKHVPNVIVTAKYNVLSFFPRNLYEQFSRLANVFFLIISCLQVFTDLSPTSKFATAGPLAVILMLNMVREIFEDSARHKGDDEVNNRLVEVVRADGSVDAIPWKAVQMGDICNIKCNDEFPADLVVLSSSGDQGMCYIDTCNLDGETNLKIRNSIASTAALNAPDKICKLQGRLEYETPNNRLYNFTGKLVGVGGEDSVDNENVLLRGSTLRNTVWALGQVIYTGPESKIMMNAQKGRVKRSNIEKSANFLMLGILALYLVIGAICTIGMAVWVPSYRDAWYIPYVADHGAGDSAAGYITFLLLLNNFIPISLYVSMEVAKSVQGLQINWDIDMYHPETDTPALTRTTNLNEELGQIQYIFSDKTGTLTQNVMEFRKCFISGVSYGFGTTEIGLAAALRGANVGTAHPSQVEAERSANPEKAQYYRDPAINFDDTRLLGRYNDKHEARDKIEMFMRILSVSHTVVPEGDPADPKALIYQAESPDEGALTLFAKAIGWCFCGKTSTHTTVKVHGADEVYEVLNVNKFNSTRKRMSVVARTPEGKLVLYCKGADNVMLERIAAGQPEGELMAKQLQLYATEGLRTLVLASKDLTEEEWLAWDAIHKAASTSLEDRDGALERAAELIEKDMIIAGATAIEDKLQDGVPDAIATLAQGGIKIWVLTGDKQETAENIGFACRLLRDDMTINYINGADDNEIKTQLRECLERNADCIGKENEHLALLVDGKSLITIMADTVLTADLLKFATMCKAVIACRVSPSQKMQIVAMVRHGVKPEPMTLSIGDGANDVPMILEAHVGVGISGNEGMQAVRSADFAIAQFRYLKKLMLFHGRNNYRRVATLVQYSLYKNILLVSCLALYNFVNGWSGTLVMDTWVFSAYNVLFTSFFIVIYAFLDQDVSVETAMANPQLYIPGQRSANFNSFTMSVWVLNAVVQAALAFGLPTLTFAGFDDSDKNIYGVIVMMGVVITANLRLVFISAHISWVSHFIAALCVFFFFAFILVYSYGASFGYWNFSGSGTKALGSAIFWLVGLLTFVAMSGIDVFFIYLHRHMHPNPVYVIQERDRGHGKSYDTENGTSTGMEGIPLVVSGTSS